MSLREEIIEALIAAKIPSPRLEADIILKYAAPEYPEYSQEERQKAESALKRRVVHEPLDKIIGCREFYKYVFKVNSNVLSPRPDTEVLVESALELIPADCAWNVLDLGTGSGCILLSLLKERPNCQGVGVDISSEALKTAAENAALLNIKSQLRFVNADWQNQEAINGCFDIIVSNPPYIPSADIKDLEPEVKYYDPMLALNGGEDGLDCYRQIAKLTDNLLKPGGFILLEAGINQAEDINRIFVSTGLTSVKIVKDLTDINRCVILKK